MSDRKIGRRAFVASALATSVAAFALPRTAKATDSRIEILLDEPTTRQTSDARELLGRHAIQNNQSL